MPFADIGTMNAVVIKTLTDGLDIVAERHAVAP